MSCWLTPTRRSPRHLLLVCINLCFRVAWIRPLRFTDSCAALRRSNSPTSNDNKRLPGAFIFLSLSPHSVSIQPHTHTHTDSRDVYLHSCLKVKYSVRCRHSWFPRRRKSVVGWLIFRAHRYSTHCENTHAQTERN